MAAMRDGNATIPDIVELVYAAYPDPLKMAARASVCSHLQKLEQEGRVRREGDEPIASAWHLV